MDYKIFLKINFEDIVEVILLDFLIVLKEGNYL